MSEVIKKAESATKTHLRNIMQLVVFHLNDGNYYGINVSKVRSFEDFKRYKIIKNQAVPMPLLEGYIQYHEEVVPVLNIEKWLDIYQEGNPYYEYMVCEYNRRMVALPIAGIKNIYNVEIGNLQKPESLLDVLTYNSVMNIGDEEVICLVLDVEKLIFDAFGPSYELERDDTRRFGFTKELLIAEDSMTAQAIMEDILSITDVKFRFFNDGQEIIDHLAGLDEAALAQVGMVITDLEMPRKDGYQVIRFIKENATYAHIPVVVNTSMSNKGSPWFLR